MSEVPPNDTYKQQNKKLIRATFKKAFINSINTASNTVDIYYVENPQTIIRSVPIAKNVSISGLVVGQRCRIDIFDETNPSDVVLAYTY